MLPKDFESYLGAKKMVEIELLFKAAQMWPHKLEQDGK